MMRLKIVCSVTKVRASCWVKSLKEGIKLIQAVVAVDRKGE